MSNRKPIDVEDVPELDAIVRESGGPRVLRRDGEDVALLVPISHTHPVKSRRLRGRQMTREDALWALVGSASSDEPTDAAHIHEYFAEAYPATAE